MTKATQHLAAKLKAAKAREPTGPLWKGPGGEGWNAGVSYSMLSRFLTCRERFKVTYIDGWSQPEGFNHYIEYGHMFHLCDETHAAGGDWQAALKAYCAKLCTLHPLSKRDIDRYWRACRVQFELYLEHWAAVDKANRQKSVDQEWVFDVPYTLPSGRTVRLRGKTDGVFTQTVFRKEKGGQGKLFTIKETKTKGEVNVDKVMQQITFDLQTMIYVIALTHEKGLEGQPIKVFYNLVKRPLGNGSIKQHKPSKKNPQGESTEGFFQRLKLWMKEDIGSHFGRVEAVIAPEDVATFKKKCLDPLLENVAHFYDVMSGHCDPTEACYGIPFPMYRHPYGVENFIDRGGETELDEYLRTGIPVGLVQRTKLFNELEK